MEAYINGISAISPQMTYTGGKLLQTVMEYDIVQYIKCIEPPYEKYIDPMTSRRMSRLIKMGVCAALQCLHNAGVTCPDAIITGTGLGCLEDTEKFLKVLYDNEEKLLNPTPFIQSTHNTVAAAIALMLKCRNYNNTFVHRGFSFENAMLDGLMLLQEGSATCVLLGGLDELTPTSFNITRRLGFWKKKPVNNLRLLDYKSKGSLPGEGIAFFVLSNQRNKSTIAKIKSLCTIYKPAGPEEIEEQLTGFVKRTIGNITNLDLVLLGMNGDQSQDGIYYHLKSNLFKKIPGAFYKHLCGEYNTSTSFAMYLASAMIKEQSIPAVVRLDDNPVGEIKNILIYNHVRTLNHSMLLVSSC